MNLIHGSDGPEAAAREMKLYFSDDELFEFDKLTEPALYEAAEG